MSYFKNKIGNARQAIRPPKLGVSGVYPYGKTPETGLFWQKNAGHPLCIPFSSSLIRCLNRKYLGHWGLKGSICVSKLTPSCHLVSLTWVCPFVTICMPRCV